MNLIPDLLAYVWPDGTWAAGDVNIPEEYSHMSDDYMIINMSDEKALREHPDQDLINHLWNEIYGDYLA